MNEATIHQEMAIALSGLLLMADHHGMTDVAIRLDAAIVALEQQAASVQILPYPV